MTTIEKLNEQIKNAEIVIKAKQKSIRNAKSVIRQIEKDQKFSDMEKELEELRAIKKSSGGIFG